VASSNQLVLETFNVLGRQECVFRLEHGATELRPAVALNYPREAVLDWFFLLNILEVALQVLDIV